MSVSPRSSRFLVVCAIVALLASGLPASALAKTHNVDCTKQGDLQKAIDAASSGDSIEITGRVHGQHRHQGQGPDAGRRRRAGTHGITGVAANTDG